MKINRISLIGIEMVSKKKATLLTFIMSLTYSIVNVIFGLIYTRLIIGIYGSNVNGLVSTLTQFVSLFTVVEGGFTTAVVVATYDPIVNKNYERLNDILYTAKNYFNKIGILIAFLVIASGSFYILFLNSPFSYIKTFCLLLISCSHIVFSIMGLSKYNILLEGSNKKFILYGFSLFARTLTWVIALVLILLNIDVLFVYFAVSLDVIVNIIVLRFYEKSKFPNATYNGRYRKDLIKGTGDVMFQKIANTIFTSTDLILISSLINLESSSVYNLYYTIYRAITIVLSSATLAPFNSFGQLFSSNTCNDKIYGLFDKFQVFSCIITTSILSTTGVLIIPFINIYTNGINDIDYVRPVLAILFFSQMFLQILNSPCGIILNTTGNFKMQNVQCIGAALINLFFSVVFIRKLGVNGVVLGSVLGTLLIFIMNITQAYKNVLHLKPVKSIFILTMNYCLGVALIISSLLVKINTSSYFDWLIMACLTIIIVFAIVITLNVIINRKSTCSMLKYIFNYFKKM